MGSDYITLRFDHQSSFALSDVLVGLEIMEIAGSYPGDSSVVIS